MNEINESVDNVILDLGERLGEMLIEKGLLDRSILLYIKQKQEVEQKPLWKMVVQSGFVTEKNVALLLCQLHKTEYCDPESIDLPDEEILSIFNRELCLTGSFMPIRKNGDKLMVILGDSLPDFVSQIIFSKCGYLPQYYYAEPSKVLKYIRYAYYFIQNPVEVLIKKEMRRLVKDVDNVYSPDKFLDNLLHLAVKERATDIHITPGQGSYHILFRVDGVLSPMYGLDQNLARLVSFIKLTAEMDISEQRKPQDGSFRFIVFDSFITVRVSTIVTEFGERTVMRILPESNDVRGLAELGFFSDDMKSIAEYASRPHGLILITGPTGSGKSSTLHAALRMQHLIERNILTVEDPLEYRVPATAQTEVNRRSGYDFQTALRHFLRHDPDVILLGEMRDAETALAAIEAAATGHLVLSTLHVTSVFGVLPRLLPMGIVPQILAENLLLVINQRLVRANCQSCITDYEYKKNESEWLGVKPKSIGKKSTGCKKCRGTGFYGRLPVYEIQYITESISNLIADGGGREAMRRLSYNDGFKPIGDVARKRVLLGQTTTEEVRRVIGE